MQRKADTFASRSPFFDICLVARDLEPGNSTRCNTVSNPDPDKIGNIHINLKLNVFERFEQLKCSRSKHLYASSNVKIGRAGLLAFTCLDFL